MLPHNHTSRTAQSKLDIPSCLVNTFTFIAYNKNVSHEPRLSKYKQSHKTMQYIRYMNQLHWIRCTSLFIYRYLPLYLDSFWFLFLLVWALCTYLRRATTESAGGSYPDPARVYDSMHSTIWSLDVNIPTFL